VFDEVTRREGGKRAAQRSAWIAGSTAVQTTLVAAVVFLSASIAKRVVEGPIVPVKIVKSAAPPTPPPPPPPPPARKAQVKPKAKVEAKPRAAMVQPKEVPQELRAPDPTPPEPEDEGSDEGVEGGVIGGVAGGIVGGAPAPAAPPQPAGPVKFNSTMTPPVLMAGPPLEYSQQALEHEVEGVMVVECLVTTEGVVHDCRVVRSVPFMDRAVVTNLEHRRYKPATLGGKALDVQYTFTIRLKLPQ
jgi:periplasmic protein TonB